LTIEEEVTAMKYQLIIFDLDGTLMDSIGGISKSVNMMLEKHGYPTFPVEGYFEFVGNGLLNTVKGTLKESSLTEEELKILYNEMLTYYQQHYDFNLKPYEGAKELLSELEGQVYMAINSNKNDDMVQQIVKDHLHEFSFESVWGVKEGQPFKPNPWAIDQLMDRFNLTPADVLFVGDSEVDIMTAENAGVDSCFVTWGFRKREHVADYTPKYIVDDFNGLSEVIKGVKSDEK
jgi:phosphoglycolate phosphatase